MNARFKIVIVHILLSMQGIALAFISSVVSKCEEISLKLFSEVKCFLFT